MEKLVQLRVDEYVKVANDEVFNKDGISTQTALRMIMYHVAKTKQSPFDNLLSFAFTRPVSEELRQSMIEEQAKILGFVEDDAEKIDDIDKAFKDHLGV
jgi:addiction module RelB/DinJ family antitoxin